MTALATNITSSPVYPSPEGKLESAHEKVVVFLSLVATLKYQPVLDSVMILVSSASQDIIAAAMKMLSGLILWCSTKMKHTLLKADLIPQLINTLNPLSLSLSESYLVVFTAPRSRAGGAVKTISEFSKETWE
ncbi:hypothetical protein BLNAU_17690 [Blattamonas nauphoetae]|uniref:Uncharacterized protein n=1 Tax=Blattamonas nauphoetae TaxID=2049346 RepID=A0ABQ9X6N8_9EUKA|nr:hypothetical protein BLNAU_17690 [Blattamonas nauphoetae]